MILLKNIVSLIHKAVPYVTPIRLFPRSYQKDNLPDYSFIDCLEKAKDGQTDTCEYYTPSGF